MIFLYIAVLIVSFVALVKGADFFVDGSSSLAKILKVPGVVIGLTVVALGTSLPELAVSTAAAIQGANEIALSNVVGSNLFNLLVVLGLCAAIHNIPVDNVILKRDFPVSIFITAALFLSIIIPGSGLKFISGLPMAEDAGLVYRITGIISLVVFAGYITFLIIDTKKHPVEEEEIKSLPLWKCILLIVFGLALIIAGGEFVVFSAKNIARFFGMSETLIGLTIVAIGTSLPELVTSIVAARKGEVGLAVGNVVGSNIFNILLILGVSSTVHPVAVNGASVYDMAILISVSIMSWIFCVTGKRVVRGEGIVMLLCYAGFTVFAIIR